jgi:hypothetical protein
MVMESVLVDAKRSTASVGTMETVVVAVLVRSVCVFVIVVDTGVVVGVVAVTTEVTVGVGMSRQLQASEMAVDAKAATKAGMRTSRPAISSSWARRRRFAGGVVTVT